MGLPQSTRCSVHRRTQQCSDMTDRHIHPQRTICHPAGKHPRHPEGCWETTQWSMCPSLGHTCNCNMRSHHWFVQYRYRKIIFLVNIHLCNQPVSQEEISSPSPLIETPLCLASLITDVWMGTSGNSFSTDRESNLNLKEKLFPTPVGRRWVYRELDSSVRAEVAAKRSVFSPSSPFRGIK